MDLINENIEISRLYQFNNATARWLKRELELMDKQYMRYLLSHPIHVRYRDMIYWYTRPQRIPYEISEMINYKLYTEYPISISENYYKLLPTIVPDISLYEFLDRMFFYREDLVILRQIYPRDIDIINQLALNRNIYYNEPSKLGHPSDIDYLESYYLRVGHIPIVSSDSANMINNKLDVADIVRITSIPRALEVNNNLLRRVKRRLDNDMVSLSKIKIIERFK